MILWTKWHVITLIPAFVVMVIAALLLRKFLKNKEEKVQMIPIKIIAIILVVLEIAKQIYSIVRGYDLYHIPLHFCSLFIYLFSLFAFYNGKYKDFVRSFTITCGAMLFVFMAIYPELIVGGSDISKCFIEFLPTHATVFHYLALFAFVLMVVFKFYTPDAKRDFKTLFIGFGVYSLIAGSMANILKVNFNNFYECNIAPLRSLQVAIVDKLGWAGQLLYVVVVAILIYLFAMLCYGLYRGFYAICSAIKKKINKTES